MIVRNLNAHAQNRHSGAVLLAHWDRYSRQTAYRCFVKGCRNKCTVGGCVQKKHASADANWYIIPLCDDCNRKKNQDLDIWDYARLIPVSEIASRVVQQGQAFRNSRTVSLPA